MNWLAFGAAVAAPILVGKYAYPHFPRKDVVYPAHQIKTWDYYAKPPVQKTVTIPEKTYKEPVFDTFDVMVAAAVISGGLYLWKGNEAAKSVVLGLGATAALPLLYFASPLLIAVAPAPMRPALVKAIEAV
jgi:hypothetical protein